MIGQLCRSDEKAMTFEIIYYTMEQNVPCSVYY
jgi:hypothetical protein